MSLVSAAALQSLGSMLEDLILRPQTDSLWGDALSGQHINNGNVHVDSASGGAVEHTSNLSWLSLEEKSIGLSGSKTGTASSSSLAVLQAAWAILLDAFSEAAMDVITFGSVIPGPDGCVTPCRVALAEMQTIRQVIESLVKQQQPWSIFETLPYNTAIALYRHPEAELYSCLPSIRQRCDVPVFVEVLPTVSDPSANMKIKVTYRDDALSKCAASCIAQQLAAITGVILSSHPDDIFAGLSSRIPRSLLSAEGTLSSVSPSRPMTDLLLHAQFEKQANATPSRLALTYYESLDLPPVSLSYAELDHRANGLAHLLREMDVEVIPLCIERSVDLYVAVLAVLKAGSAWCPIDLTSPEARRTSLIARTKSKILLTNTASWPLVEPSLESESLRHMRVVLVDQRASVPHPTPVKPPPRLSLSSGSGVLTGHDLAYLLWTSGTTGEPKGVMIQHSAAARAMHALQDSIDHDPNQRQVRTLQFSAASFDVFVQDLFYTWGLAGCVVSGTRELVLGSFVELIWRAQPTHAHLTPSFGASIAVETLRGSTLQYVTFIGEKLTEAVAAAWAAPGITTRVYNTYGPAENAVVSTVRLVDGCAKAANVGFPLASCTAYVVNEVETKWTLVPRYGVGELALGGAQVAKGYLEDPVRTATRFVQGGPGVDERIYLTGDMVRLNDHGFEFLGRNDDLVKIVGIRIELSEISAACASVRDEEDAIEHVETLHLVRPDGLEEHKVVVTFVSVKKELEAGVDDVQIQVKVLQRASDLLPPYMVPGHVIVLRTTMPRTASNKVDRKALEVIYRDSDFRVREREQSQHQQWSDQQLDVLKVLAHNFQVAVEPLSPEDRLATLGVSSLQVTKLAWSLRREMSIHIAVLDLMRCEHLGELVDVVLQSKQQKNGPLQNHFWVSAAKDLLTTHLSGEPGLLPPDTVLLPATPIQESIIVETLRQPKAYWSHRVFDLSHLDALDSEALRAAWEAAARTFDILRTSFVPLAQLELDTRAPSHSQGALTNSVTWARQQGLQTTILQVVRMEASVRWHMLHDVKDDLRMLLARWAQQPDLTALTPTLVPWVVTLATKGKNRMMMLSMHHALHDRDSSETILRTVDRYYRNIKDNLSNIVQFETGLQLGLLPTIDQRNQAASFWTQRLASVRQTTGALNGPFPDLTQSRQANEPRILMAKMALPNGWLSLESASAPTRLQSAFGCVLASYLELKAVCFGQNVSQRLVHPDLANVVGPAMATIPVVVRAEAASAEELWTEMARDAAQLFAITQYLHPVDAKRLLNEETVNADAPFSAVFVFHPASCDADGSDQLPLLFSREEEAALSLHVEHPLALNVFEKDDGGFAMELTGSALRISQAQLELMLDQIVDQTRVMQEFPKLPLHQLQNRLDRHLLSVSGQIQKDDGDEASDISCHDPSDSITQHASKHPDWIAVEEVLDNSSKTKTVTYAQLNRLTNTIASSLASHEVCLQHDDIVALHLPRDICSLAAILAIFRSGLVYLPVDEDLPLPRKQLLIRDAGAKLVITTQELAKDLDMDHDDPPALLLEEDVDLILEEQRPPPEHPTRLRCTRSHGGYLVYTSGSTGRPKGVRVSNFSLCHFISAFSQRMSESISEDDNDLSGKGKYLHLASRAFDPHLTQLFVPWHLGYCVVTGNRTALLGNLQETINALGVTHFGSVPAVLTQLRLRPEDVPTVRVVTTGGDKASNELLDTWSTRSNVRMINFYGPTEATIGCLGHVVTQNSTARTLGLPFQGLQALLLAPGGSEEEDQILAKKGQPGELCIAGPQVATGYLNRPIEDAASFQKTSLLDDLPHKTRRIYRTGDIMRMMHDGSLEFLGRADQQAKIRGQRLELDEVVAFLREQAGADVNELDFAAAVVGGQMQPQRLFGYVARKPRLSSEISLAQSGRSPELMINPGHAWTVLLERLTAVCEAQLPAFMVPKLLAVSKIPYMAASGKVDTKLLAKLAHDHILAEADSGEESEDSGVEVEGSPGDDSRVAVVVEALQEVAGGEVTAVRRTRLATCVDSLSAVHLVALLRKRGLTKLTLADVLAPSATVESICNKARDQVNRRSKEASILSPKAKTPLNLHTALRGEIPMGLKQEDVQAVLPCLPLQAALVARSMVWMSNGREEGAPYVAQFHYCLASDTDLARWQKAAETVIASEAILRACFVQREDDGKIFQIILRNAPSPFVLGEGKEEAADHVVAQMSTRPPIRIKLRVDGEQIFVSLKIHHALYDAVAIALLLKRFDKAYEDAITNVQERAAKSLDVLTWVATHCDLSTEQLDSAKTSWQRNLHDIRPCRIDSVVGDRKERTTIRSVRCLPWTTLQIRETLKEQGIGLSMGSLLQVATSVCLSNLTKQKTSIVYGFVLSLRSVLGHIVEDGLDEFIGPCLNTLVQATHLRKDEPLLAFAKRVHQMHIDLCQGVLPIVSVEQVQRWTSVENNLFDSLLSINFVPSGEDEPRRLRALQTEGTSDMSLAFDVDIHEEGHIILNLSSPGVLSGAELDQVGQEFEKTLAACFLSDECVRVEDLLATDLDDDDDDDGKTRSRGNISDNVDRDSDSDANFGAALETVRTLLCDLLRLDPSFLRRRDRKTSLYQIGLDSITVLPLVRRINKNEKIKLTPAAVLKARTIYGVAKLLQQTRSGNNAGASRLEKPEHAITNEAHVDDEGNYSNTLGRVARDLLFVATPLQEGMLSASLSTSGRAYTYNHTVQLSEEALSADTEDLRHFFAAVHDTVLACEILRTRFIFTQDNEAPWVGVVSPTEQSDLASWTALGGGCIQLRIHHALYDASSIQAMWSILEENYRRRLSGEQQQQKQHEYQFRPFAKSVAIMQRASVAFWARLMTGYRYTPRGFPEATLSPASSVFRFTMGEQELSLLRARCSEAGVAMKAVLLLAWSKVLVEDLYGKPDVVFGQVVSSGHDDETVIGPTINTVPMRVTMGSGATVFAGLAAVQKLSDDALGPNAMACLRKVQSLWRDSLSEGQGATEALPTTLFQSLFVFDGVAGDGQAKSLFRPIHDDNDDRKQSSAYDDYPLIVSFRVEEKMLRCKLRTRMSKEEVDVLGGHLAAAMKHIVLGDLQSPALDVSHMTTTRDHLNSLDKGEEIDNLPDGSTPAAAAQSVLGIVKELLGKRCEGKDIGVKTKLINRGLDSILAIRLSSQLRARLQINQSVFQLMRGASIHDIVCANDNTSSSKAFAEPTAEAWIFHPDQQTQLSKVAVQELELANDSLIQVVLPVLPGQRSHLEQWLYSGKRFREAPWVFRVSDALSEQEAQSGWAKLCKLHEILRTTFLWTDIVDEGLVQVVMGDEWSPPARKTFAALRDSTQSIQSLVEDHVRHSNTEASTLRHPPSCMTFLEGSDGKAIMLRLHHAVYDAWSIKMLFKDLDDLLADGSLRNPRRKQLSDVVYQIVSMRDPEAEELYWKTHLARAQVTLLGCQTDAEEGQSPLGSHFRVRCPEIVQRSLLDRFEHTSGNPSTAAAIILAYARTLQHFTQRNQPTFGVNYAARSLSSGDDGGRSLDLTDACMPTLSTTPFCIELGPHSAEASNDAVLLDSVQSHLAQLARFAQSDRAQKWCPKFNSHLDIRFPNDAATAGGNQPASEWKALQRLRLDERLAADYFTVSQPSHSVTSTIERLETRHLCPHRFFFNVNVHDGLSVTAGGDEALFGGDRRMVVRVVEEFAAELTRILERL